MTSGQSDEPYTFEYSELISFSSPAGSIIKCKHVPTGELRALKILSRELADDQTFFPWYAACLRLAGQVSEKLSHRGLLVPIKSLKGDWYSIRGGEFTVERMWFEDSWNLNQFLESFYGSSQYGEGTALAVLSLTTDILAKLHEVRLQVVTSGPSVGAPHLNLKPENVLIGLDPRSREFHIKLTDFCIPMAIPFVESYGVKAPLNYSHPQILIDNAFCQPSADVFSCGLVLYRLMENRDLVPAGRGRNGISRYISQELPYELRNLSLAFNGNHARRIIEKCLTTDPGQGYESMKDLDDDVKAALKKVAGHEAEYVLRTVIQPGTVDIIKRRKEEDPNERATFARIRDFLRQDAQKIAIRMLSVAILVLVAVIAYELFIKNRPEKKFKEAKGLFIQAVAGIDRSCDDGQIRQYFDQTLVQATSLANSKRFDDARARLDSSRNEILTYVNNCAELKSLEQTVGQIREEKGNCPGFSPLWEQVTSELKAARGDLIERDYQHVSGRLQSARELSEKMASIDCRTPAWTCDGQGVAGYRNDVRHLTSQACKDEAGPLLVELNSACLANDSGRFADAEAGIKRILRRPDCRIRPDPIQQAEAALTDFRSEIVSKNVGEYVGPCIDTLQWYVDHARQVAAQGGAPDYWAGLAVTKINELSPCISQAVAYRDFLRNHPECLASSDEVVSNDRIAVTDALENCDCMLAESNLIQLRAHYKPDSSNCTQLLDRYSDGDLSVWEGLEKIAATDPCYEKSRKTIVICLAKLGKFDAPHRDKIVKAFQQAGSEIDVKNSVDNAICYSAMAICRGLNGDCANSKAFFDKAYYMGFSTVREFSNWWMALYVNAKCACEEYKAATTQLTGRQQLKDRMSEFLSHEQDGEIHDKAKFDEIANCLKGN